MSTPTTIDRVLRAHADGSYFAALVNAPVPHPLRRTPELVSHSVLHDVEPRFTIVTPAFNSERLMESCITAAAQAATLPFDWIVIDDGSEDGTAAQARAVFDAGRWPLLARATIVRNPVPIFETACDNLGFALAETPIVVELQCDIAIREPGFDALAIDALALPSRPSSVSGRCGHSFFRLRGRVVRALLGGRADEGVGLCDTLIETPDVIDPLKGRIYECDTVPRGPWVLRKADLDAAGGLDERFFFLGNDDHDFHRRLLETESRRPVYVPMSLHSPLHLGAQRRRRSGVNQQLFTELRRTKRGSPAFRRFLSEQRRPVSPVRLA